MDRLAGLYGIAFARSTRPNATIAGIGAGNPPFFDQRTTVDLLGFHDHLVATTRPHPITFQPGRDKWDYADSIGRLRPDVVGASFHPTAADIKNVARWGYRRHLRYFGDIYCLPGSFDPSRFQRALVSST